MNEYATQEEKDLAVEAKKSLEKLLRSWSPEHMMAIYMALPTSVLTPTRVATWVVGQFTFTYLLAGYPHRTEPVLQISTPNFGISPLVLPPSAESTKMVVTLLGHLPQELSWCDQCK